MFTNSKIENKKKQYKNSLCSKNRNHKSRKGSQTVYKPLQSMTNSRVHSRMRKGLSSNKKSLNNICIPSTSPLHPKSLNKEVKVNNSLVFANDKKLLSEEYFRGLKKHLKLISFPDDKENAMVEVPYELKNFLESEMNLDDYEPLDRQEKLPKKQLITINMKRIKCNSNSKESFKILSWNPCGNFKKKEFKTNEDAKLNALKKVIEKASLRNQSEGSQVNDSSSRKDERPRSTSYKDKKPRSKSKKKINPNSVISLTLKVDRNKVRRIQSAHAVRRSKEGSIERLKYPKWSKFDPSRSKYDIPRVKEDMIFNDWCYRKEIEKQIKHKLLLKMSKELHEEITIKHEMKSKQDKMRIKKMERWFSRKKRELSQKKKLDKSISALKRIQAQNRKEMNKQAFKKWLRKSMGDLRIEKLKMKEIEKEKERERLYLQQEKKEHKRIEGEIAFKEWVNKKRAQKRKEKRKNLDKSHKDKHKRPQSSQNDVFLAYSYMRKSRT
ncbi:unnamed protein product [Moneuplotes crassus]|uniref:Uncharacterized protein n=1 Tax=Euplotes crassus TaxID=5936 RepID=A0AAD1U835_EUPCR|nr:unnamed protein product [Moneuplotes crassus]